MSSRKRTDTSIDEMQAAMAGGNKDGIAARDEGRTDAFAFAVGEA